STIHIVWPAPFKPFRTRGQSLVFAIGIKPPIREKNRWNVEFDNFGRFLAAKIEFSYGAVQTVNLLALRLQWFESTPTQASPKRLLCFLNCRLRISLERECKLSWEK